MKINKKIALRFLAIIFFLLPVVNILAQEGNINIDHAYLRKLTSYDPGTIHMYLKNNGAEPVYIKNIILDGIPLPKGKDTDERITWYRLLPDPIPAKGVSQVMVKYNRPPYKLINIAVETADGNEYQRILQPKNYPFRISYIGFSENLDTVYIYLKNELEKENNTLTVTNIYLNTKNVTSITRLPDPIATGKKGCVQVNLKKSLTQGQYITVKVETEQKFIAESTVRVFNLFPVQYGSENLTGRYMDKEPFKLPYPEKRQLFKKNKDKGPTPQAYYLLCCPVHAHGTYSEAGIKIISRMKSCYRYNHFQPTYIHICKAVQERGMLFFGELADISRGNIIESSLFCCEKRNHPSQDTARVIKLGVSPRPWHATVGLVPDKRISELKERPPSMQEVRLTVYYALSQGVKGLFYRSWGREMSENIKQALEELNREVSLIKPYLKIGEPVSSGQCTNPKIEVAVIQAGYKAIVLLLINHDNKTDPEEKPPFTYVPKRNFNITVSIPENMEVKKVYAIGKNPEALSYKQTGNQITISIEKLELTKPILITTYEN